MKTVFKKLIIVLSLLVYIGFSTLYEVKALESIINDDSNASKTKIHFINVYNGDAILPESNNHFAMVDAGEDSDFPDGSDEKYPMRPGITINEGYEEKVVNYLKSLGVKKLDFIIATHAHSDHIGGIPYLIKEFKVDKLYAKHYDEKYISDESRLWDNQYVYDKMIKAAKDNNVTLIQEFNDKNTKFKLGEMYLELFNYEFDCDENGKRISKPDENANSMGIKVSFDDKKAFLAGDIESDVENKIANQIGNVDLLKLGHHGLSTSSNIDFLNTLKPSIMINSGIFTNFSYNTLNYINKIGSKLYTTEFFQNSIVVDMKNLNIVNTKALYYDSKDENWYFLNDGQIAKNCWQDVFYREGYSKYYFGKDGKALKDGFVIVGDKKYYADKYGKFIMGWLKLDNNWYYITFEDGLKTGWLDVDNSRYYLDSEGIMQTGWLVLDGKSYYLKSDGRITTGFFKLDNHIYYFNDKGQLLFILK